MTAPHPTRPFLSTVYARAALARGPLVRDRRLWLFGRRGFANITVRRLLDAGEAVRKGDRIVRCEDACHG